MQRIQHYLFSPVLEFHAASTRLINKGVGLTSGAVGHRFPIDKVAATEASGFGLTAIVNNNEYHFLGSLSLKAVPAGWFYQQ